MKGLNQFAQDVHNNAVAHGWWDEPRSFPEIIALCHSELSEALEEYRDKRDNLYYSCADKAAAVFCGDCERCTTGNGKPEGIAIELADCIIRILDYCAHAGIDIDEALTIKHEFNKSRPYKHGGKVC